MPLVAPATLDHSERVTRNLHWAWVVAAVSFVAILGAAGFRSIPGVMMNPLHHEFGWSHGTVGLAMSVNMMLTLGKRVYRFRTLYLFDTAICDVSKTELHWTDGKYSSPTEQALP